MSKELLTAILEACTDFHKFLTVDLRGENLATRVETRRQYMVMTNNDIIEKIRSSHVSVRPQPNAVNGQSLPVVGKKPPPALPKEGEQEMYIECGEGQPIPEDYLTFTSTSPEHEQDNPRAMYEEMSTDQPLDTYEEPVQGVVSPPLALQDGQQELYEEPVTSPIPPNITPTPPPSTENSGSGAVYARTNILPPGVAAPSETATEWIYDATRKDDKLKVSQLENIICKGNLEKLGGKNKKSWQVRFCVLSGPFMYFYEKESSKTYRNRITIPMYMAEEAPEHTNAKKKHFAFKLTHTDQSGKKKNYYFRSTKKESSELWLQSIKNVNDRTVNRDSQHIAMAASPVAGGGGAPGNQTVDGQQEMYEPIEPIEEMTPSEEDLEEYVDVQPQQDDLEEYIDVDPTQLEDEVQDEYEDTTQFQDISPAPPLPSAHPPPPPSHRPDPPSHRPDPPVDITKIYMAAPNGIDLRKVYVALWDFVGSQKDELSVQRGDLIHVANPDPSAEWWAGEGLDANASAKTGKFGFLPSTYFMEAFEELA